MYYLIGNTPIDHAAYNGSVIDCVANTFTNHSTGKPGSGQVE
jgi:hypothetical protein